MSSFDKPPVLEDLFEGKDLRIDIYTQGIMGNCTVVITHVPSLLVRSCIGHSQTRCKAAAMGMLYEAVAQSLRASE